MSLLANGGRIVPILAAHEQHPPDSTLNTDILGQYPLPQIIERPPLLDQRQDASAIRHKNSLDLKPLEMPCLRERGLFALPTEGDGKTNTHTPYEAIPAVYGQVISFILTK